MISDGNRNATLTYNYLNLPKTVTIGGKALTYDYDAAGIKHKYIADTVTFKYAGAFEYRQVGAANVLDRVALSEGQAVFRKSALKFEYNLKDHLGNVRVVFDEFGRVLQRTDYYPFGLEINRDMPITTTKTRNGINRYLFQGQEKQVGSDYVHFKWRMHDPMIGRFLSVGPLTEKYFHNSPFAFSENKIISHRELEGLEAVECYMIQKLVEWNTKTSSSFDNLRQSTGRLLTNSSGSVPSGLKISSQTGNIIKVAGVAADVIVIGTETKKLTAETLVTGSQITQDIGDAIETAGVVTAQPEIAGIGGTISKFGRGAELALDAASGKDIKKELGYEIAKNQVFGSISRLGTSAVNNTTLSKKANDIYQGIVHVWEKISDFTTDKNSKSNKQK